MLNEREKEQVNVEEEEGKWSREEGKNSSISSLDRVTNRPLASPE